MSALPEQTHDSAMYNNELAVVCQQDPMLVEAGGHLTGTTTAEQLVATRALAVPEITYPDLPVSAKRDDIAAAVRDHQVVVVAGETGSGKTTQLPKIWLELGRGIRGTIGHTHPRRLAARTVAQRIADEVKSPLGTPSATRSASPTR